MKDGKTLLLEWARELGKYFDGEDSDVILYQNYRDPDTRELIKGWSAIDEEEKVLFTVAKRTVTSLIKKGTLSFVGEFTKKDTGEPYNTLEVALSTSTEREDLR